MADTDFSDYQQQQYQLNKQQQIAQLLRAQSQAPVGGQVGGRVVAATPLEILAKFGAGYFADNADAKANQSAQNLSKTKQAIMADALRKYGETGDATVLTNSGIPELQAAGLKNATTPETFGEKPAYDQSGNAYVVGNRGTRKSLANTQMPPEIVNTPNGGVTTRANLLGQLTPPSPQLPTPTGSQVPPAAQGPQVAQGTNGPMSVPGADMQPQGSPMLGGAAPTPQAQGMPPQQAAGLPAPQRSGLLDFSDKGKEINPLTGQPNPLPIALKNQELKNRVQEAAASRAPSAPTVTTIADPNNPDKAIVIDARTGRKIGDAKPGGAAGPLGARESTAMNRMILSGNQAAHDLENVSKLPLSSSAGFFGGRKPGGSLMSAGAESLTNGMTSQEVQTYNTMAAGFQRSLAGLEAAGMMPSGSLTHQMDNVIAKDGDSNLTKIQKMAQIRQIIETSLEPMLDNPRIPQVTKDGVKKIMDRAKTAVPFTVDDTMALQQGILKNPKLTLSDVVKANNSQSSAQPAALPNGWSVVAH